MSQVRRSHFPHGSTILGILIVAMLTWYMIAPFFGRVKHIIP